MMFSNWHYEARVRGELEELRKKLPQRNIASANFEDLVQALWQKEGRDGIKKLVADPNNPNRAAALVATKWAKELQDLEMSEGFQAWKSSDFRGAEKPKEDWKKLTDQPWDPQWKETVKLDLEDLDKPIDQWKIFADTDGDTFASIQPKVKHLHDPEVQSWNLRDAKPRDLSHYETFEHYKHVLDRGKFICQDGSAVVSLNDTASRIKRNRP